MTLARIVGLLLALVVLIRTGRALGITSITLLALSSVPALAISLGTQQLIHDIADGFSLLLDGQIKPGSLYLIGTPKSGEITGQITSLGMRSLRLQKEDGSIVSIPNSLVASSVVTSLDHPKPGPGSHEHH
jgi:MscS family membrane protein